MEQLKAPAAPRGFLGRLFGRGGKRLRSVRKDLKRRSRTRKSARRGGRRMHLPDNSFYYVFMKMYPGLRHVTLDVIDAHYVAQREIIEGNDDLVRRARRALQADIESGSFLFDEDSVTLGPEFTEFSRRQYRHDITLHGYAGMAAMLDYLHGYDYYPRDSGVSARESLIIPRPLENI